MVSVVHCAAMSRCLSTTSSSSQLLKLAFSTSSARASRLPVPPAVHGSSRARFVVAASASAASPASALVDLRFEPRHIVLQRLAAGALGGERVLESRLVGMKPLALLLELGVRIGQLVRPRGLDQHLRFAAAELCSKHGDVSWRLDRVLAHHGVQRSRGFQISTGRAMRRRRTRGR